MAYFGKTFSLESQENFKEFIESFKEHVNDQIKQALVNHKPTLKLEKSGDEYVLTTSQVAGGDKVVRFKSGVEFDEELQGNKAKTVFTVAGDTLTQVITFENGIKFTVTRQFSENQVVATVASSNYTGPTAKRIYKA